MLKQPAPTATVEVPFDMPLIDISELVGGQVWQYNDQKFVLLPDGNRVLISIANGRRWKTLN